MPCERSGWPEVGAGFGAIRFGGVAFGAMGELPGAVSLGGSLSRFEVVGFPAGSGVPDGFTTGEVPDLATGFAPSKLGGTEFFPAAVALGKAPGAIVVFGFGERAPGLIKLGSSFCPATGPGDPAAPEGLFTCPLLPFCGLR